jgi:hypothetical protein
MARLAKARVFTRLDILHAFNRIRMHPDSEDLTTFRTRYGSYKYKVLPFSLCNGPSSLPADPVEHEGYARKVLQRLREAGPPADIKKSEFGVTETKFLGFIVSTQGIRMDPTKVEVIQDWPVPTTLKQLQSFLGFCNYYRAFLKDYGRVTWPLSLLTKKDGFCPLGPKEIEAFERAKALILSGAFSLTTPLSARPEWKRMQAMASRLGSSPNFRTTVVGTQSPSVPRQCAQRKCATRSMTKRCSQ